MIPLIRARARGLSFTSTKCVLPDSFERPARLHERAVVGAERRIELDGDDELLLAQHPRQARLSGRCVGGFGQLALADDERRCRRAIFIDRGLDRGDLRRGRAAAASDDAGAESPRLRRKLGEVVRRRVREDHARSGKACEADVRERRQHEPFALHRGERVQRGRRAGAVVCARGSDIERIEPLGRLLGRDASERLSVRVEGHQRDDGKRGDAANGLDRSDELLEVEERLEHQQVDTTSFQDLRLLAERLALLGEVEALDLAARPDRAGDEDVRSGDLSRLPREPNSARVDLLEVVLQEVRRELAAVGAEGVRLDQLRAGADEARMQRDDALRCAQVRLFGAAQTGNGAGNQRPHAAVGDDRRAAAQAVFEPARHPRHSSEALPVNPVRGTSQPLKGDARAIGRADTQDIF